MVPFLISPVLLHVLSNFFFNFTLTNILGGAGWRIRLMHCSTRLKVAGSIPGSIISIIHLLNPSDRNMALGSTQPLAEASARNIFCG
jgi:hypothetical protein